MATERSEALAHAGGATARGVRPTNTEVHFDTGEVIVSKTDVKGRITYANTVFCQVSGFALPELVGAPHSIVRHPDMPRAIFKLLWDTILEGREVFAYVKNMTRTGDYYWVFAHVTPSFSRDGQIVGFHSNRRVPERAPLERIIIPLYADLLREEARHRNAKDGLAASYRQLIDFVASQKMKYDELIFSL
ncbi:MAG TPA: PAS domain-containing protein [Xanthobacteraceae bacterium]|nr:PAS domain-containing protein [Xanthobacteraceae bacterium]